MCSLMNYFAYSTFLLKNFRSSVNVSTNMELFNDQCPTFQGEDKSKEYFVELPFIEMTPFNHTRQLNTQWLRIVCCAPNTRMGQKFSCYSFFNQSYNTAKNINFNWYIREMMKDVRQKIIFLYVIKITRSKFDKKYLSYLYWL